MIGNKVICQKSKGQDISDKNEMKNLIKSIYNNAQKICHKTDSLSKGSDRVAWSCGTLSPTPPQW